MNWTKDLEGRGYDIIEILLCHLSGGNEGTSKNLSGCSGQDLYHALKKRKCRSLLL
jgi:hypothetical protein